jgi:hypothetical protein
LHWAALGIHGPTARVETEAGVVFAKRYQGGVRPAASVAFTHRVLREAAARGLRVAAAMTDAAGDETLAFGEDELAAYPDLGGVALPDVDLTEAEARAAGALLAHVHTSLADLATGGGRPMGGVRVGTRLLRHADPAEAWRRAVAADPAAWQVVASHPLTPRVQALLTATAHRTRDDVASARPALVHGDFGGGNVLLTPEREVAVVDWDLCDVDLGVWDLARAIDLACVHWPAEPGWPAEVRQGVALAWLAGYEQARPLTRSERRLLPVLIAASRVDLDAGVLALGAGLEPALAEAILASNFRRLSRSAAGAPELAKLFG